MTGEDSRQGGWAGGAYPNYCPSLLRHPAPHVARGLLAWRARVVRGTRVLHQEKGEVACGLVARARREVGA
eukprot:scaffold112687_cov28-Tisochrysis_lutea.AAC.1